MIILLTITLCATAISFGGGIYECFVVDPAWQQHPDIIRPQRGGMSRKRFWIPAHVVFELLLIASIVVTWGVPEVRRWLLVAFVSHAIMRIWSAFDFIPKALAFERSEGDLDPAAVRDWARRSVWRLPLDIVTLVAVAGALATVGAR